MYRIRFLLIGIAVGASQGYAQTRAVQDSAGVSVAKDSLIILKPSVRLSPGIALTSSLILPGAGQAYARHYVRAVLFPLAEVGVGLFGYQRYVWEKGLAHNADSTAALAARSKEIDTVGGDTTYPATAFRLEAARDSFDALSSRFVVYQCITWAVGIYYYNVLDALNATGIFKNGSKKNPGTAAWLSAIPALGLGQFYNGEAGKAGMILMTQFNLGFLAYNSQVLMHDCEVHEVQEAQDGPAGPTYRTSTAKGFHNDWENRRTEAFRNRNMYLWYSLMFYFYGILDAVVDAHLHDAGVRMKLEPDLVPENKQVGMILTVPF